MQILLKANIRWIGHAAAFISTHESLFDTLGGWLQK